MTRVALILLAAALCAGATCAPEPAPLATCLTLDDVSNIAPGNATGSAFSGQYQIKTETQTSCDTCTGNQFADICSWNLSASVVGTTATFTQNNGTLVLDTTNGPATGSINTDGTFKLGLTKTTPNTLGQTVAYILYEGQFANGAITADVTAHLNITMSGEVANIQTVYHWMLQPASSN